MIAEEPTKDAYDNAFINDVSKFIESQKGRDYEYVPPEMLVNTYNTAVADIKKIKEMDNTEYNAIIEELERIKNEVKEALEKQGWEQSGETEDSINWTNPDTEGNLSTNIEDADNNEAENVKNPANQKVPEEPAYIFQKPDTEDVTSNSSDTIDGILTDSEKFINSGNRDLTNRANLQSFSQVLYNVLLTIAVAVSVIIGGILGIKLMTSSVEQKAEVKQLLIPYVVGCIAVFGAFGIWKLIVTFLQGM